MAADRQIARLFERGGLRNDDFLNLYQGKTTIGDFNRAEAQDFERLNLAVLKPIPPKPAARNPPRR